MATLLNLVVKRCGLPGRLRMIYCPAVVMNDKLPAAAMRYVDGSGLQYPGGRVGADIFPVPRQVCFSGGAIHPPPSASIPP